jgi:hypothetical protein
MGNAAGHTHELHSSTNTSFVNRGRLSLPTFQGAGRGNINAGRAIIFRSGLKLSRPPSLYGRLVPDCRKSDFSDSIAPN